MPKQQGVPGHGNKRRRYDHWNNRNGLDGSDVLTGGTGIGRNNDHVIDYEIQLANVTGMTLFDLII